MEKKTTTKENSQEKKKKATKKEESSDEKKGVVKKTKASEKKEVTAKVVKAVKVPPLFQEEEAPPVKPKRGGRIRAMGKGELPMPLSEEVYLDPMDPPRPLHPSLELEKEDQIHLQQYMDSIKPQILSLPMVTMNQILMEVFQDPTPIADIKRGKYKNNGIPEEVKKGRSHLIDDVISHKNENEGKITVEDQEESEVTHAMVTSRISLSFDSNKDDVVSCSRALNNFDREVIDAVSSLAPTTQIMTATTIYRVITGKGDGSRVNQGQKNRVDEAMERCAGCRVNIDITSAATGELEEEDSMWYSGNAISFESIKHKTKKGTTTYYKITSIPPFYRFAEKLGKVSIIPLRLLNSPVSKTDAIIAMQSYLLREIDSMKRAPVSARGFPWITLYKMACQEGKKESKSENQRTRACIREILDYWIQENFIRGYDSFSQEGAITIYV